MRSIILTVIVSFGVLSAGAASAQSASSGAGSAKWAGGYVGGLVAHSNVSGTSSSYKPSGWSGAGVLGMNYAAGSNLVLGVEGAASLFGSVKDREASAGSAWSVSARAGFASGNLMPFVSLGMGQSEGKYSASADSATFSNTVLGLGVESKINTGLAWRAEAVRVTTNSAKEIAGVSMKPSATVIRAGIIYNF
jgi:hypothetical protein